MKNGSYLGIWAYLLNIRVKFVQIIIKTKKIERNIKLVHIYCKDHNYEITRKVYKIPYKFNEITYNYNPDFIVNGEIIEIKNPCLYSKLLIEGTKDNAKYQKMLEYKVKIITDCSKYISYINTIYGKNYLEKFRSTKDVNE